MKYLMSEKLRQDIFLSVTSVWIIMHNITNRDFIKCEMYPLHFQLIMNIKYIYIYLFSYECHDKEIL